MASSGVDFAQDGYAPADTPPRMTDEEKELYMERRRSTGSFMRGDATHRKLKPRHIQLIGIGGTIGTALYVQIGRGLLNGGPASLFLAFTIW